MDRILISIAMVNLHLLEKGLRVVVLVGGGEGLFGFGKLS